MRLQPYSRRRQGNRRGAAATELAICLPALAILILGCIDFGRFAYTYIALTNATRSAAFYGAMNPYRGSTQQATWLSNIQYYGRQDFSSSGSDTGLTIDQTAFTQGTDSSGNTTYSNSDVTVTIERSTGEHRVSVTAHYSFSPLIRYVGMPSTISMKRLCVMRSIR